MSIRRAILYLKRLVLPVASNFQKQNGCPKQYYWNSNNPMIAEIESDLRILLPLPTWYMPQEKAPNAVRKIATALGPFDGIRRAYRTGGKPPGGGPSWRTGISFTLAIPGFFLITASVIFSNSESDTHEIYTQEKNGSRQFQTIVLCSYEFMLGTSEAVPPMVYSKNSRAGPLTTIRIAYF